MPKKDNYYFQKKKKDEILSTTRSLFVEKSRLLCIYLLFLYFY